MESVNCSVSLRPLLMVDADGMAGWFCGSDVHKIGGKTLPGSIVVVSLPSAEKEIVLTKKSWLTEGKNLR